MYINFIITILKKSLLFTAKFWWIIIPVFLWKIFWSLWKSYVMLEYLKSIKWTLLNVHLPPDVEKTPKAMEQIFTALHSTWRKIGFRDKYLNGKVQDSFSFEIVGRGGKTEFLIRIPEDSRLFFESKIYSQYPYAEIKEADDYISFVPEDIPNANYNIWGAELCFTKEDSYPIKTYEEFEEDLEEKRIDPMALLLEVMSKLKEGETIIVQIVISPANDDWMKKGEELVAKLLGKKAPKELGFFEEILDWIKNYFNLLFKGKQPQWSSVSKQEGDQKGDQTKITQMSPGEKKVLEAIEEKLTKFGFESGIRFAYIAPVEKFSMVNVSGVFGGFKQYGSLNMNSFKPNSEVITSVPAIFFKKTKEYRRKRNLLIALKYRMPAKKKIILNTEELATIYHYPGLVVSAPMMPRVQAKKGEPPASLPIGE